MSERNEQIQAAYRSLSKTAAGAHLAAWLAQQTDNLRRTAYKKEPQAAWADLQKAEAYQEILDHIKLMTDIDDIGKLNSKRRSSIRPDV